MLLSKDAILKSEDRRHVDVEVPEWGGTVRIVEMSGKDRDSYELSLIKMKNDGSQERDLSNLRAKLVSACLVDENGEKMMTADELGKKSGSVLDRLFDVANQVNSVTQDKVEGLAKNS